jgi:Uma2 family endonuclease
MVEVSIGPHPVDLPYTVRLYGVTEEMFDELADDEDMKAELIDGVMVVHSPASPCHDDISGFLRFLMRGYAGAKRLGKVLGPDSLIHLRTCRKFAPDLYFLEQKRVPERLPKEQFEGAPDLIVEVLSPSNRRFDLEEKRPAYREAGVKEIWLVDPEEELVLVDRRRRGRYVTDTIADGRVTSAVVPGFWIETAWLWAEPMPDDMECLRKILGDDGRPA